MKSLPTAPAFFSLMQKNCPYCLYCRQKNASQQVMTCADIFISFISAFNFKHLQTEKNRERLGALLKKLYFYPQKSS